MKYIVVSQPTLLNLIDHVNNALAQGATLRGGVCFAQGSWAQAILAPESLAFKVG